MPLELKPYSLQSSQWPPTGRHILAQFNQEDIVVYQAYSPQIGRYASENGSFGDGFRLDRMSWIKPNFLWMMHRSSWAEKQGQEVVLAIRLRRSSFDALLRSAVATKFENNVYESEVEWRLALRDSEVLFQWDPDHDPMGKPLQRRALQVGIRGNALRHYSQEWVVDIEDVTALVRAQSRFRDPELFDELLTPLERVYPVSDPETTRRLGISRP